MSDPNSRNDNASDSKVADRSPLEGLLDQDTTLSPKDFEEHRMQLVHTVEANEEAAARGRRNIIRGLIWLVVFYAAGLVMNMAQGGPDSTFRISQTVAIVWMIAGWGIYIFLGTVAIRYWTRQRPAVDKSRTDLHLAMCEQLQRQIDELSKTVSGS